MAFISAFFQSLAAGDLEGTLNESKLQELFSLDITYGVAAKILKFLTKAVCDRTISSSAFDDKLFRVASYMLELIQDNVSHVDASILSCIYYISKYFLKQKNFELAVQLIPYVMSIKMELKENVMKVYYGLFYEFHSFVETQKDIPCDRKLKIRCESLEILSLCEVKYLPIILSEMNVVIGDEVLNTQRQQCLEYVLKLMSVINHILDKNEVIDQTEMVCKFYSQLVSNMLALVLHDSEVLKKILGFINNFHTSNTVYNKIMTFYIMSVKSVFNPVLPLSVIEEQIVFLKGFDHSKPSTLLTYVCSRLSRLFFSVHTHWLKVLTEFLNLREFLVVSELGILLSRLSRSSKIVCSEKQECSNVDSLKAIVNLMSLGINVVLGHVRQTDGECEDDKIKLFDILIVVQTQCFQQISSLKLAENALWKDFWKIIAARSVTLAALLEKKGYFTYACYVYKNLCDYYCSFEHIEEMNMLISPLDNILKAFKGLNQCLIHQTKFQEALVSLGVAVLLLDDNCSSLQKLWLLTKKKLLCDDKIKYQKYTMFDVFQNVDPKGKAIFPHSFSKIKMKLNNSSIYYLLLWELESYMMDSDEMFESISEIARILIKLPHNSLYFAEGIELVMKSSWMRSELLKSDFSVICGMGLHTLKKLNENSAAKVWHNFAVLGNIHFFRFCSEMAVLRKKLHDDVKSMKDRFPTKEEKSVMKGLIDPSEAEMKSNIITVYSDLNICKEQELLNILLSAVEAWSLIIRTELNISTSNQNKFEDLLFNIKTSASTFALYGYYFHSLKTWKLYYSINKLVKSNIGVLFALSHLLAFSCYDPSNELWKEADKIEEEILLESIGNRQKEVVLVFWLTKVNGCLLNNQFEIGWQYIVKFNNYIPGTIAGQLGCARKYLLQSKYYLCCPNSSKIPLEFRDKNSFLAMAQALGIIKVIYQNKEIEPLFENCCLHLLKMEVTEWMGDLCLGVKLYRDGYCLLKENLSLAQMLGLATRCSQMVSKLAQFDLMCGEVENLPAKLMGLETILCFKDITCSSINYGACIAEEEEEERESLVLDDDLARMKLLDVSTPARHNIMSSPVLQQSPFKVPHVVNHKESCTCLFCYSFLIQSIVLDTTRFQAQIHVINGENDLALSFFKGGLKLSELFKQLQGRIVFQATSTIFQDVSLNFDQLSYQFFSSLSKLYMSYKEFLFLCSCYNHAQESLPGPLNEIHKLQDYNLHLALDLIDRSHLLFSEMSSPTADKSNRNLPENSQRIKHLDENNDWSVQENTGTPVSYRSKSLLAPALNRKEDHRYMSRIASPSLVVNLDSKLKEVKKQKAKKNGCNVGCVDKSSERTIISESPSNEGKHSKSIVLHSQADVNVSDTCSFNAENEFISEAICVSFSPAASSKQQRRGKQMVISSASSSTRNEKEKGESLTKQGLEHILIKGMDDLTLSEMQGDSDYQNFNKAFTPVLPNHLKPIFPDITQEDGTKNVIKKSVQTYSRGNRTRKIKDDSTDKCHSNKIKPSLLVYTDGSDSVLESPDFEASNKPKSLKANKLVEVESVKEVIPRQRRCKTNPGTSDKPLATMKSREMSTSVYTKSKNRKKEEPILVCLGSSDSEDFEEKQCSVTKENVSIIVTPKITEGRGGLETRSQCVLQPNIAKEDNIKIRSTSRGIKSSVKKTAVTRPRRKNPFILD